MSESKVEILMTTIDREILANHLKKLADKTIELTDILLKAGSLEPEQRLFHRAIVTSFNEQGMNKAEERSFYLKNTWLKASLQVIENVKESAEFETTVSLFYFNTAEDDWFNRFQSQQMIKDFIRRVCDAYLDDRETATRIQELITQFLWAYFFDSVDYTLKVELAGIKLEIESFTIQKQPFTFKIRQINQSDFESDSEAHSAIDQPKQWFNDPSAVLEINHFDNTTLKSVDEMHKMVAILRLFSVGSIYPLKRDVITSAYHMERKDAHGDITGGHRGREEYTLGETDVEKFKCFWSILHPVIPKNIYLENLEKSDFISISYDRYCESLIGVGSIEKKIASTVMGLESLFTDNKPELSYRLKKRTAKLFSLLGHDALEVDEIIQYSYEIRSKYVHGEHLKLTKIANIMEKLPPHIIDLKSLWKQVMEYLRISIVIFLITESPKKTMNDLLDKSLIDTNFQIMLKKLIKPTLTIL